MPAVAGHRRQTEPRQGLAPGTGILNDAAVDGIGLRAGNAVFLGESHPAPAQARTKPDAQSDERAGCRRDGDVYLALHVCPRASPENAAFPGSVPAACRRGPTTRSARQRLTPTGSAGNRAFQTFSGQADAAPYQSGSGRPGQGHQRALRSGLSPPRRITGGLAAGRRPTPGARRTPEKRRRAPARQKR